MCLYTHAHTHIYRQMHTYARTVTQYTRIYTNHTTCYTHATLPYKYLAQETKGPPVRSDALKLSVNC